MHRWLGLFRKGIALLRNYFKGHQSQEIYTRMENEIKLQTRTGADIPNFQSKELSIFEANQAPDLEHEWHPLEKRTAALPFYNCHGMTFASRRTTVGDETVGLILTEDGYEEIPADKVLPGDTIVYYSIEGDPEHSGIVITRPHSSPLNVPEVISKWGKYSELHHLANMCPYTFAGAKYFRIIR